jgi:hypothetical protein
MKNGSFFIPREQIHPFFNPGEMNNEEGLYLCWETDPAVARHVLPPPLKLLDPEHPMVMVYVVNIREPTFGPWYMEAAMMLLCSYDQTAGVYMLNLQLSGPGAPTGMCSGREFSGLPKKLCERIVVERTDDCARAFIEAKGKRIFDVDVELGAYNDPLAAQVYSGAGWRLRFTAVRGRDVRQGVPACCSNTSVARRRRDTRHFRRCTSSTTTASPTTRRGSQPASNPSRWSLPSMTHGRSSRS